MRSNCERDDDDDDTDAERLRFRVVFFVVVLVLVLLFVVAIKAFCGLLLRSFHFSRSVATSRFAVPSCCFYAFIRSILPASPTGSTPGALTGSLIDQCISRCAVPLSSPYLARPPTLDSRAVKKKSSIRFIFQSIQSRYFSASQNCNRPREIITMG